MNRVRARIALQGLWWRLLGATVCRLAGHRDRITRRHLCEYRHCRRCHGDSLHFTGPLLITCHCVVEALDRLERGRPAAA